jgi:hypothetical protein
MSIMALYGVRRRKGARKFLQVTRCECICGHGDDERSSGDDGANHNMQIPLTGTVCVPGIDKYDYRGEDLYNLVQFHVGENALFTHIWWSCKQ